VCHSAYKEYNFMRKSQVEQFSHNYYVNPNRGSVHMYKLADYRERSMYMNHRQKLSFYPSGRPVGILGLRSGLAEEHECYALMPKNRTRGRKQELHSLFVLIACTTLATRLVSLGFCMAPSWSASLLTAEVAWSLRGRCKRTASTL